MELLLGVLASLVATLIWVFFTKLYDMNSKKNISFLLELLYDCADNFDSAIEFSNFTVAENESDRIIRYCKEIFDNIKPFTYRYKKKKLICSLLYNAYYTTSYYKRLWVGYDNEAESKAKLNKFRRKYYYKVPIYSKNYNRTEQVIDEHSFLILTVVVLQSLNRSFLVKKALSNNMYIGDYNINVFETYSKLLYPMNLKSKNTSKYDLRNSCFTYEEYNKYLLKLFKKSKEKM